MHRVANNKSFSCKLLYIGEHSLSGDYNLCDLSNISTEHWLNKIVFVVLSYWYKSEENTILNQALFNIAL